MAGAAVKAGHLRAWDDVGSCVRVTAVRAKDDAFDGSVSNIATRQ